MDGQEFLAYKFMLSLASPVLRNVLTLQSPPSPELPSIPIVDACETGEVIGSFLRWIYPVAPKPTIEDPELLERLRSAAKKYEMMAIYDTMSWWYAVPENFGREHVRAAIPKPPCVLNAGEETRLKEEIKKEIEKEIKKALLDAREPHLSSSLLIVESHLGLRPVDHRSPLYFGGLFARHPGRRIREGVGGGAKVYRLRSLSKTKRTHCRVYGRFVRARLCRMRHQLFFERVRCLWKTLGESQAPWIRSTEGIESVVLLRRRSI